MKNCYRTKERRQNLKEKEEGKGQTTFAVEYPNVFRNRFIQTEGYIVL